MKKNKLIEKFKILYLHMIDDIQELYCEHCDKDTKQKVYESGHERDASQDSYECLEGGYIRHGF